MTRKHKTKFNFTRSKRKEIHLGNHKRKYVDIYVIKSLGEKTLKLLVAVKIDANIMKNNF